MTGSSHFPAGFQAALTRLWSRLPLETLAALLGASDDEVLREGQRLGLPAWVEPAAPQPLRTLSIAEGKRTARARTTLVELGCAPPGLSTEDLALRQAFERAATKAEKNRLALALRADVEDALCTLHDMARNALRLSCAEGLTSLLLCDLADLALHYDYLLRRTYAPFIDSADITAALRELGINRGDLLLIHSSFSSLGNVIGGAQAVIEGILDALGPEGTLVMPTLSMRNFSNAYREWHIGRPSDTGYLTDYFRTLPGVLRSDQATHSVAALGPLARELTWEHAARGPRDCIFGEFAFGHASPWQKLYDLNGKVVFIGVQMDVNTLKHLIEAQLVETRLLAVAAPEKRARLREGIWRHEHYEQVVAGSTERMWPFYDGLRMQAELDRQGLIAHARCGSAEWLCLDIRAMADTTTAILEADLAAWFPEHVLRWFAQADAAADVQPDVS